MANECCKSYIFGNQRQTYRLFDSIYANFVRSLNNVTPKLLSTQNRLKKVVNIAKYLTGNISETMTTQRHKAKSIVSFFRHINATEMVQKKNSF